MSGKRYGDIFIPPELIEAQDNNDLVIFAGAGTSNGPSLAKVAESFGKIYVREFEFPAKMNWENPDLLRMLGNLDKLRPTFFRRYVCGEYTISTEPSALHRYLIRLFRKEQILRIITTNYDGLFTLEAERFRKRTPHVSQYPNLISYTGSTPAVPSSVDTTVGKSPGLVSALDGVFHIHGSALGEGKNLVLTEMDFAVAYTRLDSRVANFLRTLPSRYTLLIVGFSGKDPIVRQFLAANLDTNNVYAICPNSQASDWDNMTITPIDYCVDEAAETSEKKHYRLTQAMKAWAKDIQTPSEIGGANCGDGKELST